MIGLDTNVLVRFLVQDDAEQAALADEFLREHCTHENPGWINRIVLCELVWILERAYGCSREEVRNTLVGLCRSSELAVEDPSSVWRAIEAYGSGRADFADALMVETNLLCECEETVTFDREAAGPRGARLLA